MKASVRWLREICPDLPDDANSLAARFTGAGIEVEGIESAIALLKGLGLPMIDETPRRGARGHKVAFIHPKATGGVLVELVEPAASEADEAKPVA